MTDTSLTIPVVIASFNRKTMKVEYRIDPPDAQWVAIPAESFRKMAEGLGWVALP